MSFATGWRGTDAITREFEAKISKNKNGGQRHLNETKMEQIKAKFQISSVIENDSAGNEVVNAHAVYGGSSNAEDNTYSAASPWGQLTLGITNPGARGFFKQGKKYFLVFTEAPE